MLVLFLLTNVRLGYLAQAHAATGRRPRNASKTLRTKKHENEVFVVEYLENEDEL